ncbi:single-stranded DNA-binding protein [Peribacillus glennii]|uniref:single-stranded DNA-binding protein n=1 Tax=Peribacillus glennii TaxID=2303991 RepID=UPI001F40120D|nr:single-stranded DNA-binding protein [Peribacillus glennii]
MFFGTAVIITHSYTPEGKAVSNITLAVNRNFRNHGGGYDADFVQCTLWKKTAENTVQYCRKGSIIGITGRIQTRSYDNHEGKKVYVTEVVAEGVRFVGPKQSSLTQEAASEPEMIKTQ